MSQLPGDPGPADPRGQARRGASATLRTEDRAPALSASLDPAQRSLAEALRISFFLLQAGMLVLIALFLLSGARQVRESERGIRLTFGRVQEQDVPPGLHFSWPYPIGEFVAVQTGLVSADIDEAFFPSLTERQRRLPLDQLTLVGNLGLTPGKDGSLITGDRNVVHAQWRVEYHRDSPADFIRNVHPPDEARLVRTVVERAVVRAVGEMSIDALLKQGGAIVAAPAAPAPGAETPAPDTAPDPAAPPPEPGAPAEPPAQTPTPATSAGPARGPSGESALSTRVRELAQAALDAIDSGIRIDQALLKQMTPPLSVRPAFQQVQSAQSSAEKAREEAEKEKRTTLSAVAGLAHGEILGRIDAYERAIETGDEPGAAAILGQIHALLEGEPVEIDGRRVERLVSGDVTDVINRARQYRTQVVSATRSDAEAFRAKLEQYRASPAVLLNREWTDAYLERLASPNVQVMLVPPGSPVELWLNADPDFLKEQERERNKAQIQSAIRQRERDFWAANREQNRRDPNPQPRQ